MAQESQLHFEEVLALSSSHTSTLLLPNSNVGIAALCLSISQRTSGCEMIPFWDVSPSLADILQPGCTSSLSWAAGLKALQRDPLSRRGMSRTSWLSCRKETPRFFPPSPAANGQKAGIRKGMFIKLLSWTLHMWRYVCKSGHAIPWNIWAMFRLFNEIKM